MNIDGVKRKVDFEVIEIIDVTNPYPTLLGIEWDFDNVAILNLKKRQMRFESEDLIVVTLLDPNEGEHYVELVREDLDKVDLDHFYNVTVKPEDYINPIVDGKLSWTNVSSCSLHFDDAIENWKHRLYEVSTRKCTLITKHVHWIGPKVWEPPRFDGLGEVEELIEEFE